MEELEDLVEKDSKKSLPRKILGKLIEPITDFVEVFEQSFDWPNFENKISDLEKEIPEQKAFEKEVFKSGFFQCLKMISCGTGIVLMYDLSILAHESLHAIAGKAIGFKEHSIHLKSIILDPIIQKIYPWINQDTPDTLMNSALNPSSLEYAAMCLAPYILTPIGFGLVHQAKKYKSPFLAGAGIALTFSPLFNILGTDMYEVSNYALDSSSSLLHYSIGTGIALSVYLGSKYIAEGIGNLINKFRKKQEEKKPGLLKKIFNNAKYCIAVAALSLGLGYFTSPAKSDYPKEIQSNLEQINRLYGSKEYEKSLALSLESKANSEYSKILDPIIAQNYAQLVFNQKITEQEALADINKENLPDFYLTLLNVQIGSKEYEDAKKTLEKVEPLAVKKIHKYVLKKARSLLK